MPFSIMNIAKQNYTVTMCLIYLHQIYIYINLFIFIYISDHQYPNIFFSESSPPVHYSDIVSGIPSGRFMAFIF